MRNWVRVLNKLAPILALCGVGLLTLIIISNYANRRDISIIYFIFKWPNLVGDNLNFNILLIFSVGCCVWGIFLYYLKKLKESRITKIINSLILLFPFWFTLFFFAWLTNISSNLNFWLVIYVFYGLWIFIGLAGSILVSLSSKVLRMNYRIQIIFNFKGFKVKKIFRSITIYESLLLISITSFLGFNLSAANYISFTILIPSILSLGLMVLAINVLLLINFLFSILELSASAKISEEFTQKNYDTIIKYSKILIQNENIRNRKKKFDFALKYLEKGDIIDNTSNSNIPSKNEKYKGLLYNLYEVLIETYKERGKIHLNNAQKSFKKGKLSHAQDELKSARNDFQRSLNNVNLGKINISAEFIENEILNTKEMQEQLEIEKKIVEIDLEMKKVHRLEKSDLPQAIEISNDIIRSYSKIKEKHVQSSKKKELVEKLESKIQRVQIYRSKLYEKMDGSIGIKDIPSTLNERDRNSMLSIIREYEFIGGQIRFKIGIINNTIYSFTNLNLAFDLPEALKWIIHEPNYERKGDSILISKLGAHEKQAVSLYLEPINCMQSSVNVTVSFSDAKEKPHAIPMKPKMISVSCPIFFTENEVNLARVKSLRRSLSNRDKKVFPIIDLKNGAPIFSSIILVLGKFDIKLVYKEFDNENNFGEAWFYGITKVKKNRIIPYVMLDGENKVLEFEVTGDDPEQITSFLAEVSDRVRQKLIHDKVLNPEEKFFDMRITVMSSFCPYCYTLISDDLIHQFLNKESIQCKNCFAKISLDER